MKTPADGLLRIRDIATRLGMVQRAVYRMYESGELRPIKLHPIRFDPATVEKVIQARKAHKLQVPVVRARMEELVQQVDGLGELVAHLADVTGLSGTDPADRQVEPQVFAELLRKLENQEQPNFAEIEHFRSQAWNIKGEALQALVSIMGHQEPWRAIHSLLLAHRKQILTRGLILRDEPLEKLLARRLLATAIRILAHGMAPLAQRSPKKARKLLQELEAAERENLCAEVFTDDYLIFPVVDLPEKSYEPRRAPLTMHLDSRGVMKKLPIALDPPKPKKRRKFRVPAIFRSWIPDIQAAEGARRSQEEDEALAHGPRIKRLSSTSKSQAQKPGDRKVPQL